MKAIIYANRVDDFGLGLLLQNHQEIKDFNHYIEVQGMVKADQDIIKGINPSLNIFDHDCIIKLINLK